jgi:hypothetical protein
MRESAYGPPQASSPLDYEPPKVGGPPVSGSQYTYRTRAVGGIGEAYIENPTCAVEVVMVEQRKACLIVGIQFVSTILTLK